MIAYRNDYPVLPCAPFDSKNPPAANLLWLFYVSKVRLSRYPHSAVREVGGSIKIYHELRLYVLSCMRKGHLDGQRHVPYLVGQFMRTIEKNVTG